MTPAIQVAARHSSSATSAIHWNHLIAKSDQMPYWAPLCKARAHANLLSQKGTRSI